MTQVADQEAHDTFITPGLGPSPVLDTTTPETPGGGSRRRRFDWIQPLLRNPKALLGLGIILFFVLARGFCAADR